MQWEWMPTRWQHGQAGRSIPLERLPNRLRSLLRPISGLSWFTEFGVRPLTEAFPRELRGFFPNDN
jgi:hypothetical protein